MKICEAPCGLLCNDNGFWVEHDEETNQDILCNKADGAFPATRDHLGSVQIGHGLDIDESGIISLDGRRDIGDKIFYYEGTALPSIDVEILKECYEKFADAYYLSLIWHKNDVDVICAIVETDDDSWTKSLNLIIYNKYYCSYKWNPLTRDFVDPEVTTFDTMGMFVGIVTNGDSFPVQRLDGTPINDGDYVLVSNMSSFPFSIGDITFNSPRDKAVYVDDKWNLIEAVIQDTDETVVTDPRVESLSGLGSYQADVNREVKNFINVNVSMPTLAPTDNPWLIRADYEGRQLDDEFARRYINRYQECLPKIKGTTSVYKGDLFGQNVGGTYDNSMTFVVRTSKNERHMIGTVSNVPQLTREFVESKAWHDYYRLLPYLINEGQNDEGLFVGAGSVPIHETLEGALVVPTTGTNPSSDQEVCATMLPALLLLHCKTVVEAIEMIGNLNIYCPHTPVIEEELHFIIGDKTDLILVEFLDNNVVIKDLATENQVPWMLNFYQSKATFVHRELPNVDHIGSHANGLRRNAILNENYDDWTSKDLMLAILQDEMRYTNMYVDDSFGDEFCGQSEEYGDLTIEQWVADPSSFDWVRDAERVKYDNRDRDVPNTWQTVYTAVHTIDDKKLYIVAQEEGSGQQYEFEMIHSTEGIGYEPDPTHGIGLTSVDKLEARLDNERGLEFNSDGEIAVKVDNNSGVAFNENGEIANKIDNNTLRFDDNGVMFATPQYVVLSTSSPSTGTLSATDLATLRLSPTACVRWYEYELVPANGIQNITSGTRYFICSYPDDTHQNVFVKAVVNMDTGYWTVNRWVEYTIPSYGQSSGQYLRSDGWSNRYWQTAYPPTTKGDSGQVWMSNGSSDPSWQTLSIPTPHVYHRVSVESSSGGLTYRSAQEVPPIYAMEARDSNHTIWTFLISGYWTMDSTKNQGQAISGTIRTDTWQFFGVPDRVLGSEWILTGTLSVISNGAILTGTVGATFGARTYDHHDILNYTFRSNNSESIKINDKWGQMHLEIALPR